MQSIINQVRSVFLGALGLGLVLSAGRSYDFITDNSGIYVVVWNPGTVNMKIMLPVPATTLSDGSDYNSSVQTAMQAWNARLGTVQFSGQVQAPGIYSNGNRVNEIAMDNKIEGADFGANVLAVTMSFRKGNSRSESDVIFNTAYSWDSYRGPRSGHAGKIDLQRVAIHELGHVLGLDHPDEASPPQVVTAILNSRISDVDTMQADDIAGAQVLYGVPGVVPANNSFANAVAVTLTGSTAQVTGSNVAATHETGEPAHAGGTGTSSVWWKWPAPSSGSITMTTLGSNFDTALAVYTGTAVAALTQVAANDDVQPGVIRTSTVTFNAIAGTTYLIAVDGWETDFGAITLNLTFGGTVALAPPIITSHPASQTTTPGGSAIFSVTASGNPTGYQWSLSGTAVSGATSATLNLTNVQAANAGPYKVTVTNADGAVTSNSATLTVLPNPVASQIATAGHDVAFSATGTGGVIQWQVSTDAGVSWSDLSNNSTYRGVATNTLEITGVTSALSGNRYRLVSVGSGGSSTSNVATLTVSQAFFPMPVCLDVDAAGNLYVGDTGTDTVQKITSAGAVTLLAGTAGQTGTADGSGSAARFNEPSGLASAADGTLAISDLANATVRRITVAGGVTTLAGSAGNSGTADGTGSAARFNGPIGIAQDAGGTLYVADSTNHTIRRITNAGVVTTIAGAAGASGTADGTGAAARFNHPTGIAADGAGNLYVADTTNNTIRKVTSTGAVSTLAGLAGVSGSADGTGAGALFNRPGGLIVDSSGTLFVADTGNSVIRRISATGVVTTFAGLPGVAGLKDGVRGDAWFNQPQDVALDSSGNLYVADTGNATIRKITPAGEIGTLALTLGTTPAPVTTPPPTPAPSSGGGGGGSMDYGLAAALGLLCLLRLPWAHAVGRIEIRSKWRR